MVDRLDDRLLIKDTALQISHMYMHNLLTRSAEENFILNKGQR